MPTQVDHSRPVRTVDERGSVISTDTSRAAPMKSVDSVGRAYQADAADVAKQAAAANPETAKGDALGAGEKPKEGVEHKPTEAEVRKEWLQAQKAKRKAAEFLKMAQAKLSHAEEYEKAKAKVESGEDPTALVSFAKLDPIKHYQDWTAHALKQPPPTEDPVQKELREHRERLDKYQKDLEVQARTIQEKEDLAAHNQVIQEKVIPLIRDNPDKYEALTTEYGPNAPVEVYKTVWEIYQQTGKARSFQEVADEMEAYWTETIGKGLEAAAKLKKFQNRFAQGVQEPRQTSDPIETPRRSVTLSNKPFAPARSESEPARKRVQTRDERVAEILKRFPD